MTTPDRLRMTAGHLRLIIEHVRSGMPHEVCGLLGGVGGQVKEVFPVPNVAPDPATGFVMDPQAQIDVLLTLEERGWDLVAIYHSHPPGARTDPSPTDVAQAHYPEALSLLLVPDPSGHEVSVRAFTIRDGQVSEVPVVVLDEPV